MDQSNLVVYNVSFTDVVFKADRRKVTNIFTPLFIDTDVFEWGGINITTGKGG